jgi:hypothetical protein
MVGGRTVWEVPGTVIAKGLRLEEGAIEIEIGPSKTEFIAILFHGVSVLEHERVYLRRGASGRKEAMQYVPVWQGFVPWRLYPNEEGSATFAESGWTTVRVEFRRRRARVYVDGAAAPALDVDLRHESPSGFIGFGLEGGVPPLLANFRYTDVTPSWPDRAAGPASNSSSVSSWELSPVFSAVVDERLRPDDIAAAGPWHAIASDAAGLVDLHKHRRPAVLDGRPAVVAARARIRLGRARPLRLGLGYCERVAVFVNGRRAFTGALPLRSAAGDGYLRIGEKVIEAQGRAGVNEVMVVVSGSIFDGNGGWGFRLRHLP